MLYISINSILKTINKILEKYILDKIFLNPLSTLLDSFLLLINWEKKIEIFLILSYLKFSFNLEIEYNINSRNYIFKFKNYK